MEYGKIEDIDIKGLFIVTDEDKPILAKGQVTEEYFYVPKITSIIKSTTGAGDSFLGAFLAEYKISNSIESSVTAGITSAQIFLQSYSNNSMSKRHFKKLFNRYQQLKLWMPKKIIIAGPSCAGKTTLINKYPNIFSVYNLYNDLNVLQERVKIDNGESCTFEYHDASIRLPRATKKLDKVSFRIIDENLWNEVLLRLAEHIVTPATIEFSRGSNELYEKGLSALINETDNENVIVIFVYAGYRTRLKRNFRRRESGGHFVELKTFKTSYKNDCRKIFIQSLMINGVRVPVILLRNGTLFKDNLQIAFLTKRLK
jgi:uridine kinase